MTNHEFEIHQVQVFDARNREQELNLDTNGACLIKIHTSLRPNEAATSMTPAVEKYTAEVLAALRREFPEYVEIKFMDFLVSCTHSKGAK